MRRCIKMPKAGRLAREAVLLPSPTTPFAHKLLAHHPSRPGGLLRLSGRRVADRGGEGRGAAGGDRHRGRGPRPRRRRPPHGGLGWPIPERQPQDPWHVYLSDQLTNESRRDCRRRLLVRQSLLRAFNTCTAAACYRDGADGIADKAYIETTCTHVPKCSTQRPNSHQPTSPRPPALTPPSPPGPARPDHGQRQDNGQGQGWRHGAGAGGLAGAMI